MRAIARSICFISASSFAALLVEPEIPYSHLIAILCGLGIAMGSIFGWKD